MVVLLFALGAGIAIGLLTNVAVPAGLLTYLAVIVLAALDACVGGVRASLEHTFSDRRFVAGFFLTVFAAVFVVFLGVSIGLRELYLAAAIPLVIRMFSNLGTIRELWFERHGWE